MMAGKRWKAESEVELPDDVLEEHIFSKLPVETLWNIRPTSKQWNRVVLSILGIPEGTNFQQCLVQTFWKGWSRPKDASCFLLIHKPVQEQWYFGRIPWPENPGSVKLVDAEGPLLLHIAKRGKNAGNWIVQNPLRTTSHLLPADPQLDCVHEGERWDLRRAVKLIPGTAAEASTAAEQGVFNYRALMVTVAVPIGAKEFPAWVYTHLYSRVTDCWRLVTRASMGDKAVWPRTKDWHVAPQSFDGRFVYCCFHVKRVFSPPIEEKLWAFDTVLETWKQLCTDSLHAQNPLRNHYRDAKLWLISYRYVFSAGKLFAIARYGCKEMQFTGFYLQVLIGVIIYEYTGSNEEDATGSWVRLHRMPEEFVKWQTFLPESCEHPVVNGLIYFGQVFVGSELQILVFNVHKKMWTELKSVSIPGRSNIPCSEVSTRNTFSMTPNRNAVP